MNQFIHEIFKDSISFECKFKKVNRQSVNFETIKVKGFFKLTPNSSIKLNNKNN